MAKRTTKRRAAARRPTRANPAKKKPKATRAATKKGKAAKRTQAPRGKATRKGTTTRKATKPTRKATARTTAPLATPPPAAVVTPPPTPPAGPGPMDSPTSPVGGPSPGSPSTSALELVVREVEASLTGVTKDEALDVVVDVLSDVAHYNWVGVYLLDGDMLQLGPYRGAETEHVRIPIGQGICGLAARTAETVNVPDVNADPRYLACFANTRSELVVPIFDPDGAVVGEIDIDSDTRNAFTQVDESVVERIARLLTPFFARPETAAERFIGTN